MTGILTALWHLARPDANRFCLEHPPSGFRLGRCSLESSHSGVHMDNSGSTWVLIRVGELDDEGGIE